jgi:hypothetical protein
MAERMPEKAEATKRTRKRLRLTVIFGILVVIAVLVYRHIDYLIIDERLAAIEASRSIPASENAAILYDRLLQDPNALVNDLPAFLDPNNDMLTRSQPWTANDYPKLAVWIKKYEWLINELMKVSQFEKCQFPLIVEPNMSIQLKRLQTMRKWTFLLCWAANNDVGEGRIDDAIAKWQCRIQIGKHLRQQSKLLEYLEGISIEAGTTRRVTDFLAEGNAPERHLRKIESFEVQTQDDWAVVMERILPVDELIEKKYKRQLSLIDRLKYEFNLRQFKGRKDPYQIAHGIYLKSLVVHRGMYIMVDLRRYKNKNGHWPQTLDRIKPWVSEEILTDPHNNGPFVYKLTDDGFILYSKGKNNIDEGGRKKNGADDWPIWLPKDYETQGITTNKR